MAFPALSATKSLKELPWERQQFAVKEWVLVTCHVQAKQFVKKLALGRFLHLTPVLRPWWCWIKTQDSRGTRFVCLTWVQIQIHQILNLLTNLNKIANLIKLFYLLLLTWSMRNILAHSPRIGIKCKVGLAQCCHFRWAHFAAVRLFFFQCLGLSDLSQTSQKWGINDHTFASQQQLFLQSYTNLTCNVAWIYIW